MARSPIRATTAPRRIPRGHFCELAKRGTPLQCPVPQAARLLASASPHRACVCGPLPTLHLNRLDQEPACCNAAIRATIGQLKFAVIAAMMCGHKSLETFVNKETVPRLL